MAGRGRDGRVPLRLQPKGGWRLITALAERLLDLERIHTSELTAEITDTTFTR